MSVPHDRDPSRAPDPEIDALVDEIDAFVRRTADVHGPMDADTFDSLAGRVFALQYGRVEPFRRLCDHRGVTPDTLDPFDWRHIPAVPVVSFRRHRLCVEEPREVFRSSGTTGGEAERSVHHHPFPGLYRTVIESRFPGACLPAGDPGPRPMLSLIPSRQVVPDSSLGFMAEHVLARFGDGSSVVAMDADGLRGDRAEAWCRSLGDRPGTVLATAFALAFWLDELEERGVSLRLPPGSTLFETGGFKGRTRELERRELLARIEERLGLPPSAVVREYGMTELTGHVYSETLSGGDPDLFTVPPFMAVRLLDPETLEETAVGEPGLVTLFDLANVGSVVHVITQDLGVRRPGDGSGFRLLGRAADAQLRGCSLTAEELSAPHVL